MPDDADVSTWKINPAGMIRYFNNVTYTLHHAVADLVDNCIDAAATKIEIWMDYDRDTNADPYLWVADNGTGISEDDWEDAVRDEDEAETELHRGPEFQIPGTDVEPMRVDAAPPAAPPVEVPERPASTEDPEQEPAAQDMPRNRRTASAPAPSARVRSPRTTGIRLRGKQPPVPAPVGVTPPR